MGDSSPKIKSNHHVCKSERLDTVAARRSLVDAAKQAAREEDEALKAEGLHMGSSDDKVASYRGIGLGLYFKLIHWMLWMMIWMMVCSVPYLITINTSVFTDYIHRYDHNYGVKVYDSFELASFTFAAIVDDKKDNGTLQYMNTDIADAWKGPMQKGVFLTWVSLADAGATVVLTGVVAVLFVLVRRWLEKVDKKTREVADYAVIVSGLPPYVTATEVGEYFERHFTKDPKKDKVMDVVLISGFSTVVKACKEVHRNEQLKRFVAGIEAKLKEAEADDVPPSPVKADAANAANAEDPDVDKIALPAPPAAAAATPASPSPAAGGRPMTFSLTAVASAAAPISPRPPTSPPPPPPSAPVASLEDAEAGKQKQSSLMTRDMRSELAKARAAIREQEDVVLSNVNGKKLRSNAAFVTFNTEQMRAAVCKTMPSGWWASLVMHRELRLEHGGSKWRLWVRRAAAPDDYRFENMSTRPRANLFIQVFTGATMCTLILVCAALITWLSAASNKAARLPKWDMKELTAAIGIGMAKMNAASSAAALNQASYDAFCGGSMASCVAYVQDNLPGTGINMTFGSPWTFPNVTSRLLHERPIRQDLLKCAESVSCPASYCLPCYCLGLSASVNTDNATPELLSHLRNACSNYFQPLDLRRDGLMIAISVVIAVINAMLTFVLRQLKFHVEKHWTTTDTELSYAIWAYLVKLINSVVVLLVVNCSSLGELQKKALEGLSGWVQRLILDGLFDDFTPDWYASIGFSIMVLMMINVAGPLIRSAVEVALKWALQARLLYGHMGGLSAPEDYNAAFRSRQFTLEERIADVLFNVTLALLFGSGLPLCYLIAAVYLLVTFWWDRLQLLSWRQPAQRYQNTLPRAMLYLLPVLLMAHCAFGLWMHTYFRAHLSGMDLVAAAASAGGKTNPGFNSLTHHSVARRITQPNGLALLIWFLALGVWLLCGRWILWAVFRILGSSCARLTALILPREPRQDDQSDVPYEEALSTVKVANMLRGPRTYRISHLPHYRPFLDAGAAGRLWARAQGEQRFTRLTTFRVHVEMEVTDGRRKRTEHREVEMFDVADAAIKLLPNAAAALAATQAAAASTAAAAAATATAHNDTLPMSPQLPMPPSRTQPTPRTPTVESPLHFPTSPQPKATVTKAPPSPCAPSPKTDTALVGLLPSTTLQTATLQQVATLQANTGAVVKRVSLRAVPDGLLLPGHSSSAAAATGQMVVAPAPPLPPFELDLQPVVVRSLASLRLLPVRDPLGGGSVMGSGSGSGRGSGEGDSEGDGGKSSVMMVDGSEPMLRVQRSASAASASSSHVSIGTTLSAPATYPAGGGGSERDGAKGEISEAAVASVMKDQVDGNDAPEAPVVVQAEAVVLAEAVAVAAVGSKAGVKGKSAGGGAAGGSPTMWLKSRVGSGAGGGVTTGKDSSGPRARAAFRFKSVPLEQLAKPAKASVAVSGPVHGLPPPPPPPRPLPLPPQKQSHQSSKSESGEMVVKSASEDGYLSLPLSSASVVVPAPAKEV